MESREFLWATTEAFWYAGKLNRKGQNRKRENLNESLTTDITLLVNTLSDKHSTLDFVHDLFHRNSTFAYHCEVIMLGHNTKVMEKKRHLDLG